MARSGDGIGFHEESPTSTESAVDRRSIRPDREGSDRAWDGMNLSSCPDVPGTTTSGPWRLDRPIQMPDGSARAPQAGPLTSRLYPSGGIPTRAGFDHWAKKGPHFRRSAAPPA